MTAGGGGSGRPTVLLDVDGTLVDTNHLHALAWARAIRAHGHEVTCTAAHRMIGAGAGVLMAELIGAEDDAVKASWRDQIDAMVDDFVPLPGAVDLIDRVRSVGACVVLATSSPQDLVDHHLDALGIGVDRVDAITTDSDVDEAKPEPDVFVEAMRAVDADPDRTVVVGDSVWDVRAAHRSDLPAIALTCGGTDRARLLEAGAQAVYRDAAELLDHARSSPLRRLADF